MSVPGPAYGSPPPYGSTPPAGGGKRPATVQIAFWLYIATALIGFVSLLTSLASFESVRQEALRQIEAQGQLEGSGIDPAVLEGTIVASFAVGIVIGVLFLVLWVLFAIFLRRGFGWARWVLLGLTILGIFGLLSTNLLSILGALLPVAATVLAFLPQSVAWYRDVRAAKLARTRTLPT